MAWTTAKKNVCGSGLSALGSGRLKAESRKPKARSQVRALGVAVLVLLAVAVRAQQADPPNPLATVKALKCRFPLAAYATWKEGAPKADLRMQELSFEVKEINVQDSTASFSGTTGTAFVSAVLSGWSLYFVESSVGQMNITTVFAQ